MKIASRKGWREAQPLKGRGVMKCSMGDQELQTVQTRNRVARGSTPGILLTDPTPAPLRLHVVDYGK